MQFSASTCIFLLAGGLAVLAVAGCGGREGPEAAGSGEDLLAAVERGDGAAVMRMLEAGVIPRGTNGEGKTAVMLALEAGKPQLAEALIEGGASVGAVDREGASALFRAVQMGELSVVEDLLDRGASAREMIPGGGELVAYALEQGRTAAARMLFSSGATRRARGTDGSPVSFIAMRRGLDWLLRDILARGAEINARDRRGETLLHVAVRADRDDLLAMLWSHGADPDAVNREGRTPLHLALERERDATVVRLLELGASPSLADGDGNTPLLIALQRGDGVLLRALLEHGARADVAGPDGRTAVTVAMARREFEVAQVLVDRGAKVEGQLREAIESGDEEMLTFLLANGADPNASRDEPPLVGAIRRGDERVARILLEAGAEWRNLTCEGQGLFHLALARGLPDTVRLLLDRGADPNQPFRSPVRSEFLDLVRSEGSIKWYLEKDRRVTPLMMATDSGNLAMAKLLMSRGANKNVWTGKYRLWPINFASRRNDVKIMQLLLDREPTDKGRWIRVDLSDQKAWVYETDGKVLLETKVSTGKKGYRTSTGEFVVTNKYRKWYSTIYDGASMPYFQRLSCGDFGFHEGYCPGYPASHGCIRVPRGNAAKLFELTRLGDRVAIVE